MTLLHQLCVRSIPRNFKYDVPFAKKPHYSASCKSVVGTEDRKSILRKSKRCFNCLCVGHNANTCQNEKRCLHCEGRHHQSICPKKKPVTKNEKDESETRPDGEEKDESETRPDGEEKDEFCGATTLTRVGNGSVLLQTARPYAVNGSTSIPVRILFDTGSQRSYVTNDVARRLRLNPVKRETLNLNTFGTNKSKRQSCELYKFNIQKQKQSIEMKAINFSTICSPVNAEVRAENYKHLKGLELANFDPNSNGDKNIDILIGTDFYWEFVTGEVV